MSKMNKIKVRITGYAPNMIRDILGCEYSEKSKNIKLKRNLNVLTRSCNGIGDEEVVNHTVLGRLRESLIPFIIVD